MDELKAQIRKLAKVMEENTLLDYELSGYMKDSVRRKIFRESATHRVLQKKKLAYIDQMINGINSGGSGKFLVATADQVSKRRGNYPKGSVFSIRGYGQKGRYEGDIGKVIKNYETANATFKQQVLERALKKRLEGSA